MAIESDLSYLLVDKNGKRLGKGEGRGRIGEENLTIYPKFGEPLQIPLKDITDISAKNYKLHLVLSSNEKIILFDLGYHFEDFLRILGRMRNELFIKNLLMHETLRKSGVRAEFEYSENDKTQRGEGEVRLYETGLVIIPDNGEMFRIPYSDISDIKEVKLGLMLKTEYGGTLTFRKMGAELDPFKKVLSDSLNELHLKVINSLRELMPNASMTSLRMAARFMKEGRAACRKDIEAIDPELWAELEKKLESSDVGEEYNFLKELSRQERICIGVKRGLMGDLTGEYIWFLIPIYDVDPKKPGNAIAMEATSEGGGKATYFFRIVSRKEYPKFKRLEDLDKEVDYLIRTINKCMLDINFRREPIYLPDEKLEEPQYQKYKFAIQKIPSLRTLRCLFIGRVIHASSEQWRKDVMDLLTFNVSTLDDSAKWYKSLGGAKS